MIRNRHNTRPYVTKDKSMVWELYHPASSPARGTSLAEAVVEGGKSTGLHLHAVSQEIYYFIEGGGTMRLGDETFPVRADDAVLIPPGTPHNISADSGSDIRLLCICTPPYSHEDTGLAGL